MKLKDAINTVIQNAQMVSNTPESEEAINLVRELSITMLELDYYLRRVKDVLSHEANMMHLMHEDILKIIG